MNKRKIVICVWNDIDKDDRVMKKAVTLSKKFSVIVKSVCKCKKADTNPRENKFVRIVNDNLIIEYYWFNSFFEWLYYRLIANKNFWSDKITDADMYDCNDPDTLHAGVFAKKRYGSKILYDSHEFWKGTRRKEYNMLYTAYSFIGNTIQYNKEKSLVHYVNGITTVSESIANILRYEYNKPVCVIENRSTLNKYRIGNFENPKYPLARAVFFGSKIRPGALNTLLELKEYGFIPTIIGDYSNNKLNDLGVECLGFLDKDSYQKELAKCAVAVLDFEVTCDNIKFCMPNKLFEYIQAGIPIIANDRFFEISRFIKDKEIGVVCNSDNRKSKVQDLISGHSKYRHNINKISYKYSWENQEDDLLSYYDLFIRMD